MIWIFAIVAVVLVTIIVQLLLVYQKRAHDLRMRQEPLRRHIREHLRNMDESTRNIRRIAGQRLEELGFEIRTLRAQSEVISKAIAQLENEVFGEVQGEIEDVDEAVEAVSEGDDKVEDSQMRARRETLSEVRRRHEEIEGHASSMRREVEIVKRTLERIEARMQRRQGRKGGSR